MKLLKGFFFLLVLATTLSADGLSIRKSYTQSYY